MLHRVAIMSKDGDWILKEDEETMTHILNVLSKYKARYRYCAPLEVRWMGGGWSSHFEFRYKKLRVRTDFFTRPPRISEEELHNLWKEQEGRETPYVNLKHLVEIKKTNREKDYAIIGDLARLMKAPRDQLLYSRSARDLMTIARKHSDLATDLAKIRPVLAKIPEGKEILEKELDAERRELIRMNEKRLETYMKAAVEWSAIWPSVEKEISGRPLMEAHKIITDRADGILPFHPVKEESRE